MSICLSVQEWNAHYSAKTLSTTSRLCYYNFCIVSWLTVHSCISISITDQHHQRPEVNVYLCPFLFGVPLDLVSCECSSSASLSAYSWAQYFSNDTVNMSFLLHSRHNNDRSRSAFGLCSQVHTMCQYSCDLSLNYYTRLMASFPGQPR